MPLSCGKNLNQESIKDVQSEMKDFMKKGRTALSSLKKSNMAKQLDVNKLKKIPKKLKEVTITGTSNIVTVPENTYIVATVYGKKAGSGLKFLIIDYIYDDKANTVSTTEKVSELIVTVAVPDGSEEINLQDEIGKLQGTKDINEFIGKASEIQLKFGTAAPTPDTTDVTETAENTSSINLSDKPINVLKVMIMKEGNNFFSGTNNFKIEDTVISLYVGGEPNKPLTVKKIKVKYSVPGTSSVAMGSKGNFDINQILAKVTKDKNFTTNDLKSLDQAKVKGLMGSYQKDIGKGLNKLDTTGMTSQEKDLINQFKGGINKDGSLNLNNLDTNKIFGSANQIASMSSKGKIEEKAVNKMLSGDLAGAFEEGKKLSQMGGSKIPGIPTSFDLTKNQDPTSAITGLFNLQTSKPSSPTLRHVDYSSRLALGNTVKTVTMTKPVIEILFVEGQKAGTNFFSKVSFTRNGNKITTNEMYRQIKVTYKTPSPEIKPGEAFGSRPIDTCKDIPEIKVVIQEFKKEDLVAGKTLQDFTSVVPLSKPKKVPEKKPQPVVIDKPILNLTSKISFANHVTMEDEQSFDRYVKLLESKTLGYYEPEVEQLERKFEIEFETPEYKKIKNIQRQNNNKDAETLLNEGKITTDDMAILRKLQPLQERYLNLTTAYTDGTIYKDEGIMDTVSTYIISLSFSFTLLACAKICFQGDDLELAKTFNTEAQKESKLQQKLLKITTDFYKQQKKTPSGELIFNKDDFDNLNEAAGLAAFNGPPDGFPTANNAISARTAAIKHIFAEEKLNQKTIDLIKDKKVIETIIPLQL